MDAVGGGGGEFATAKTIKNLGTDIEKLKTELIPRSGSGIKWQTKSVKGKKVVIGPRGRSSAIDPNLKSFHGARWGVALHCSMLAGGTGRGTIQGEEGAARGG